MIQPTYVSVKVLPCMKCGTGDLLNFAIRRPEGVENGNVFVTQDRCRSCSGDPTHHCSACERAMNRTRKVMIRGHEHRLCKKCRWALETVLADPRKEDEYEALLGRDEMDLSQENLIAYRRARWSLDVARATTEEERPYILLQVGRLPR